MKLSIIIPAHNAEQYLSRLISSIKPDVYQEQIEVLIVENNSTDETYQLATNIASEHQNIKVIKSLATSSGGAINDGLKQAAGEYTFISDADDIVYIDDLLSAIDDTVDVVSCKYKVVNVKSETESYGPGDNQFTNVYWNKIYKHKFLQDNDLKFIEDINVQDGCFNAAVLLCKPQISFVDNVIYEYYVGHGSISDNMNAKTFKGFLINNSLQQKLFAKGLRKKSEVEYHKYYRMLVYTNISNDELLLASKMARNEWYPVRTAQKSLLHKKALSHVVHLLMLNGLYLEFRDVQGKYLNALNNAGYENQREYLFYDGRFAIEQEIEMLNEIGSVIHSPSIKKYVKNMIATYEEQLTLEPGKRSHQLISVND